VIAKVKNLNDVIKTNPDSAISGLRNCWLM